MGSNNPQIFQDELLNNNIQQQYNNNNNNNSLVFKFNPLFDLESNKENNLNQANIFNNNNNNNNSLHININNSFSLGLNKKPLSSPRISSPRSINNSGENIFQQQQQQHQHQQQHHNQYTSSLLEDTISNLNKNNNEEVIPNKKHRNSQILSKNFVSLSLETDSPKHSRSTTDLNTFFHESDPDQFIYSRSKTICGGDLPSLLLDFGNNKNNLNHNNSIFTKYQNNNNIENLDNDNSNSNNNKPTVVHSHSSNSLPNRFVNSNNNINSMITSPSVLSSSAPSLMSLLESSSTTTTTNNNEHKLNFEEENECDITVNVSQQHISFSIDSPLKDSMCNDDDDDDDDSTPATPIQRPNNLYRSASSILSPPLLVSNSSAAAALLSRQGTFNNGQIYPSSPELSPKQQTSSQNLSNNQSHDDDSPNTSVDNFGTSPYKTPSKLSSSSSSFYLSNSSPSAGSKRSRTCLDFTKYSSSIDEEQSSSQQIISSSPTNIQLLSSSQTTITSSPTISPRLISSSQPPLPPTTTTNTLNSIQQNLKQNMNIPSYLNPLQQRSNSISGSRPPRPLSMSMSMSMASFRAPDIAAAKASSHATLINKPLPFDNIPTTLEKDDESNVYKNETQKSNILKFIEEQNKRKQQQQEETNSQVAMAVNEDEIGIQEEIVDFEHEQNKPKLLTCQQTQGFNSVAWETVVNLLNSKTNEQNITIIDCRYEYEYLGGHIKNAINIPPIGSRKKVFETFFENPKNTQHIIIFHCEFSSKRAPDCYKLFREIDRSKNCYPYIHYPEIYLLQGGYKKFYENCSSLCIGQYIRMDDKNFTSNLKEEEEKKKQEKFVSLRNIKARSFKTRSHSFHI